MLTPSGFPVWCWFQVRPRCWLLGHIFYFSIISVFFWLSCVNFGIRANIDLSEASRSQSRTRKKITTKKKKTHARPITHQPPKPIKSTPIATEPNNHQPPTAAKPKTSPHSLVVKTQNPTPHLWPPPMPKPETSSCHSSMPHVAIVSSSSCRHQASVSNIGWGPSLQRLLLSPI